MCAATVRRMRTHAADADGMRWLVYGTSLSLHCCMSSLPAMPHSVVCASRVLAECKIDFAEYAHPSSGGGGAGPNTAATVTTFRLGEVRPNRAPEGTRAASRAHSRSYKHTGEPRLRGGQLC
jgi:hypothetical protein